MKNVATEGFWRATLFALLGPLVWSIHLGLIYLVQHVGCAVFGRAANTIDALIILLTFAGILLLAIYRPSPRWTAKFFPAQRVGEAQAVFLTRVTQLLNLLAIIAVFWQGAVVLLLPTCAALR